MFKHDVIFKTRVTQRLRDKAIDERKIEEFMASLSRGEVTVSANRGFIVTIFLRDLHMITENFCKMKWGFLRTNATDQVFLLSDNPLVLTDVGEGEPESLGILNPTIEVTMPLDPATVAVARWDAPVGYGTIQSDCIPPSTNALSTKPSATFMRRIDQKNYSRRSWRRKGVRPKREWKRSKMAMQRY